MGVTHAWKIWHNKTIPLEGLTSEKIPCSGFHDLMVYLHSPVNGYLDVLLDPSGESLHYYFESGFYELDLTTAQRTVTANNLKVLQIELCKWAKIKFTPVAQAVVDAWVVGYAEGSD